MTMTFKVSGNLAADPEFTTFKGGEGVRARLRVATDRPAGDGKFETDFHDVVVFGAAAESLREARIGARVEISGSVRPNSYERDGQRHFAINFVGHRITWQSKQEAGADRTAHRSRVAAHERTDEAAAASR